MKNYSKNILPFLHQFRNTNTIFMSKFKLLHLDEERYQLYFEMDNGSKVVYRNFSVGDIDVVVYPEDGLSGAIAFTEESGLHPMVKDWEKY